MTTLSKAIQISKNGGPEELKLVEVSVGEPGAGEIRIKHHAIGLNFIDVYQRSGVYALPMPLQLGMEGAGVIEAVGAGVTHLKVGDRAAYAANPPGSYCERRVMPAMCVCKLPDAIGFETGAAMMLKGLTAQYLLRRTLPQGGLQAGDFVLFHAAAGGVGHAAGSLRSVRVRRSRASGDTPALLLPTKDIAKRTRKAKTSTRVPRGWFFLSSICASVSVVDSSRGLLVPATRSS